MAGAALVAGGLACVAPCEVAVTACVTLVLLFFAGRVGLATAVTTLVALVAGGVRAHAAVVRHERAAAEADVALPAPARCSARARVTSSPVSARGTLRYDARLERLTCDGAPVPWSGDATLYDGPRDVARGDELDVVATLAPPQRLWNPSGGDPRPSEARRGVLRSGGTIDVRRIRRGAGPYGAIDRIRAHLRARIDATFPPEIAAMARALVLGESDLSPDDDRSFRASGLSHLLAVSGMHLVLVLGVALDVLRGALVRVERVAGRVDVRRACAAVGIPLAWCYAQVAGDGGSTVRAAWMATAVLLARMLGARTCAPRAFGLSMVVMALADPLVVYDLSFLLSTAATGGLLAFASPLSERFAGGLPGLAAPLARAVATTVAATVPCAPVLAWFSPTVPLGGIVANLLAVPLGECAALPICLVHACLSWWPSAERGSAIAASGALTIVRWVARTFSAPAVTAELPQPTSWQLASVALALASFWLQQGARRAVLAVAASVVLLLEVLARRAGRPAGVLRATFLDVGQGDAAIIDLPDGEAMVVDGGGLVASPIDVGARVLAPELRRRRRGAIAAAVLTHPHPDHFAGLLSGLEGARLGALWDTGQGEREGVGGGYEALLRQARARGTPVLRPDALCGERALGGARVEVLAPCPGPSPDRNPNDNSIVLRITYGARAMLLVGDAEREEEGTLLATAAARLRADVLKVGHHGSRTSSSPAFLAAVAPREAIVSAGRRNRFGHPSPQTLAALRGAGSRVWRTDRDGAVEVTTDGRSLDVRAIAAW
jgi:competence protein ComEC